MRSCKRLIQSLFSSCRVAETKKLKENKGFFFSCLADKRCTGAYKMNVDSLCGANGMYLKNKKINFPFFFKLLLLFNAHLFFPKGIKKNSDWTKVFFFSFVVRNLFHSLSCCSSTA